MANITAEEVESWKNVNEKIQTADNWVGVLGCALIFFPCIYVLFCILVIHRRTEPFLIATTISFGLYALLGLPNYIVSIQTPDENYPNAFLLISSIFFIAIAHLLFTIQYLQTSIILPLTLKEAQLEWLHDTSFGGEMMGRNLEHLDFALLEF